jgi:ribosomal protection tetracycline resistance protein
MKRAGDYFMNKVIGLLAHVDAGKTTFAEQILYHTKCIKNFGRVDHKNSFLDSDDIEKQRGITVFSNQAVFKYNQSTYYLIDTPGHADFSPEMERSIAVMDYAILVISGVDGLQAQTEVIWNLLRKYNIPTFFFINKIDREENNMKSIMKDINVNLTDSAYLISYEDNSRIISKELMEFMADRDDALLERYIEEDYDELFWIESLKRMIKENRIFICMNGSALFDIGIDEFLEKLDFLTFTKYDSKDDLKGIVYKVRHDEQRNKLVYMKILSGSLKVKDEIEINCKDEDKKVVEKVNEIRLYNGDKFKNIDTVNPGQLVAVKGLKSAYAGCGIGKLDNYSNYNMVPALKSKVIFDKNLNPKDVLECFKILEEEDPSLRVSWNQKLQEIEISVMGTIQLEVLKEIVEKRFKIKVEFGPCKILYKETILSEAYGCGHFEPLRHYAEVHLKLDPGKRNTGIVFKSICHVDTLDINYQKLIKKHIYEREHRGILTGSPLTDIVITLVDGRSHIKHTSGGDFREATFRALRQGLENAENILLEPYYNINIKAEVNYMGRILADIKKLSGTFKAPEITNDNVVISARGPVSEFMNYTVEFMSFTKGRGRISMVFDGYDVCHNQDEVIKKISYNKDSDPEYTSSSVFCSKGQPFLVKGSEARKYMHCLK